ncbi:MAG: large conductance mechanosensitive channel protein MscL [Clostridiales bacterium]|nr:large conductance mechanosensitive channel protein MscL [Clostridiales bacterium]
MKKFINEFKEFALKGSMMDLAIGIIIGSAFTAIVSSLVDDIINPFLGLFTGHIDFSNLFVSLDGEQYATLEAAESAGAAVIKYGSFISNVINFIIMALVVFLIVKVINTMRTKMEKKPEEAAPTTKNCPYCQSEISIQATRCPNCTSQLMDVDMK